MTKDATVAALEKSWFEIVQALESAWFKIGKAFEYKDPREGR